SAGSMSTAHGRDAATLLSNGSVLVVGGQASPNILSSADLYTPGGTPDPSQSTISVAPAAIPSGGSATVTLTVRDDAGKLMTTGGLAVNFLATGGGFLSDGTFSN